MTLIDHLSSIICSEFASSFYFLIIVGNFISIHLFLLFLMCRSCILFFSLMYVQTVDENVLEMSCTHIYI